MVTRPIATAYPIPDPAASPPLAVEVNGVRVLVERLGQQPLVYYARFQFHGKVTARVTPTRLNRFSYLVKPDRMRLNDRIEDGALAFDIDQPGPGIVHLNVGGNEIEPAYVIAEPMAENVPDPNGVGVTNVADRGVKPDP